MPTDLIDPFDLETLLDTARKAGCTRIRITADGVDAEFAPRVGESLPIMGTDVPNPGIPGRSLTRDVRDPRLWGGEGPPKFRTTAVDAEKTQ